MPNSMAQINTLRELPCKRKPCVECPWRPENRAKHPLHHGFITQTNIVVQGCHMIQDQVVLVPQSTQHACMGHLAVRLDQLQRSPCPDEELLQDLTLVATENM